LRMSAVSSHADLKLSSAIAASPLHSASSNTLDAGTLIPRADLIEKAGLNNVVEERGP
jgi:hypothetical protein